VFTGFQGAQGGTVKVFLRGSFSGPYPEALVTILGCEGHSENWGGLLLVRELQEGWIPTTYLAGVVPRRCDVQDGADGVARLACEEQYSLNSGTYFTAASVIDFQAQRATWLLSGMCEDGRDVDQVRWGGADQHSVEVTVSFGVRRDNDGQHCFDLGGKKRSAVLVYTEQGQAFEPSEPTKATLLSMVPKPPSDEAIDPAVQAATHYRPKVPKYLLPERHEASFADVPCPQPSQR
jgi:hypothetical protein